MPLEALDAPALRRGAALDPALGERRVQVDDVRHDGRTEDPGGEEQRLGAVEARDDEMPRDLARVRARHQRLEREGDDDHADQGRDHGLEAAEPMALEREDGERARTPPGGRQGRGGCRRGGAARARRRAPRPGRWPWRSARPGSRERTRPGVGRCPGTSPAGSCPWRSPASPRGSAPPWPSGSRRGRPRGAGSRTRRRRPRSWRSCPGRCRRPRRRRQGRGRARAPAAPRRSPARLACAARSVASSPGRTSPTAGPGGRGTEISGG